MSRLRSVGAMLSIASLLGCVADDPGVRARADAGAPPVDMRPIDAPSDPMDATATDATVSLPLSIALAASGGCRDLSVAHVGSDALFGFEVTGPASSTVEIWASRPPCGVAPFLYETVMLDATGRGSLTREHGGTPSCDDALLGTWTVWASQAGVASASVELILESAACSLRCAALATFCPATTPPPDPCAPLAFSGGAPFTATLTEPLRRTDFDVADGLTFGRIDVELDFVRGPWAPDHPPGSFGMHNVFWLHRGTTGSRWRDNSIGYLNFTSMTNLRLETNIGLTDPAVWSDVLTATGAGTTEGESYHAQYSYDAEAGRWWIRLSDASGTEVAYQERAPLLDSIAGRSPYPGGASSFFIEIGHLPWGPDHDGPEVATLGWTYSNVEVRFYPLGSSCP